MYMHITLVQSHLNRISHELQQRAVEHDVSKLTAEEFDGFSRINRAASENAYGSPEYRAGLAQERPTVDLHYSRNSHHPEHHKPPELMGWLDIIEMVCDWRSAYVSYGSQGTWEENIERQKGRYTSLTPAQWWLIEQVAMFVAGTPSKARKGVL